MRIGATLIAIAVASGLSTRVAVGVRQPGIQRVPVTVSTIPCKPDPLHQSFPRIVASAAQIVDEPRRLLDGSFNFTVLARPGLRTIAINSSACRGFKSFVVLDSTARHIDVLLVPYPGGRARGAPVLRRDPSAQAGSVAGLLPIPNLSATIEDGHGKTYPAESDGLAYYVDAVPPGKYFLSIAGEGYKGRYQVQVTSVSWRARCIASSKDTEPTPPALRIIT